MYIMMACVWRTVCSAMTLVSKLKMQEHFLGWLWPKLGVTLAHILNYCWRCIYYAFVKINKCICLNFTLYDILTGFWLSIPSQFLERWLCIGPSHMYEDEQFPGMVKALNKQRTQTNCLARSDMNWNWPADVDKIFYHTAAVLKIPQPKKTTARELLQVHSLESKWNLWTFH